MSASAKSTSDTALDSFSWLVQLYQFDLTASNVFYFNTELNDTTGFTSHYFNITQSISPSLTNVPTSSTSGIPSPTSLSFTPTSTSNNSSSPSDYLPTASNTGLAVGLGISIPLLLIVVATSVFLVLRRRRRRRRSGIPRQIQSDGTVKYPYHELQPQIPLDPPAIIAEPQSPRELMITEQPLPELPGS